MQSVEIEQSAYGSDAIAYLCAKYDKDGNGKASRSELMKFLHELKAKNADQRLEIVRAELGRREARISLLRGSTSRRV